MRAGELDRRATLQSRSLAAPNARGEKAQTFTNLATVWAKRRHMTGREFFAAGQKHAEASVVIRIRYRSDVTPIHRIICEGVTYDVVHIDELGRRAGLDLVCKVVA